MDAQAGRRPTVLIVEDIDWIRAAMRRSVERRGYRAVEASGTAEAIELAVREPPELILTDEELPALDALVEFVHEMRALRRVPVVIVNPDAEEGTRLGDALVLTSYESLAALLNGTRE